MSRFCKRAGLILIFVTPIALSQQEEEPNLGGEDLLSDEIIFDDNLFGNIFDESPNNNEESWLEGFTVRVSQQFYGQVNNHSVEPLPGFSFPRKAEMENNRLGLNIRYQNAFAPGWLLQASGQARAYWNEDYEYRANGGKIDAEYRVNEFFLQRSFEQNSFKFGRQTVVWGETVGNSVLDVMKMHVLINGWWYGITSVKTATGLALLIFTPSLILHQCEAARFFSNHNLT